MQEVNTIRAAMAGGPKARDRMTGQACEMLKDFRHSPCPQGAPSLMGWGEGALNLPLGKDPSLMGGDMTFIVSPGTLY